MSLDFFSGFATGLALIVAIGSQNAYVLRQGILRQHVLPLVLFCGLSDALLILAGIGGAGLLVRDNPLLMTLTRYGGALFLLTYGVLAARRAWQGEPMQVSNNGGATLTAALAACFAFTFLNPHVYLDTVVLLGALANQRPDPGRWIFGAGAVSASLCWFAALGFGARFLAPLFATARAWQVLDALIALTMWVLATLLLQG
ncbi:LysE/ArgO family amino acid transporter [Rhodoferax sp.]|uniref:LysE/ArgO family amino acid transporter n=1 Tax=Rhodoferax sp. TaxID=50421 RepID=UPI00273049E1|nr:LysE/ArgO family amino acid transporter [Rhodoferax sp.]MDP1528705.1 LysE/ArgO family amino acid transporter [Rhodoferax sp.]MDP1943810.1 LysE/ArgO family amino acid transporter [Rhodoferax sp.]MDP2441878.1 LysE/ArgO family amino acid transporter [Rhodoferax sp.]MDZ4208106.1 LysE/ArgO family amino acid transporter [Rhodoferax sp.]